MAEMKEREKIIQDYERRTYELETKMKAQKETKSEYLSHEAQRLEIERLRAENNNLSIEMAAKSSDLKKTSSKVRGSQFANQD